MNGLLGAFTALFLKQPARVADERTDASAEPPTGADRLTVLAIDDDQAFLDTLRPALRMEGFNVMTAISGAKGLDMLRFAKCDVRVVLLDFQMPRLTGTDTLQHVRKLLPKAKILGLTGVAPKDLPEEFSSNVDQLMSKPYKTSELVACINSLAQTDEAAADEI